MSLLQIDRERCHRDGICADVCPALIITLEEEHGYPALVQDGAERCIRCGHCVAVCPHGALSHAAMAMEDCPAIERDTPAGCGPDGTVPEGPTLDPAV